MKTGIFCCTKSVAMMLKIMYTHDHYITLGSCWKMASSHRVTDLKKNPVRISKDEAPMAHSFCLCGVVCERLLPCCVVTAKWVVSCTQITWIQPLSRCSLTLLASPFFSESGVFVLSLLYPSFSPCVLSFLSLAFWPFCTHWLACLIRAAILYFSCHLHLFTSQCFVIGSPD